MWKYDYQLDRDPITADSIRRMPRYATAEPIAEVSAELKPEEFEAEFRLPQRPVVIRGALKDWRAFDAWRNMDYLEDAAARVPAKLTITHGLALDHVLMSITERAMFRREGLRYKRKYFQMVTLKRFLELLTSDYDPRTNYYARHVPLPEPIRGDVGELRFCGAPIESRSLFFGRRTFTDIHEHHGMDAFMCQLSGRKEVILFPPDDLHGKALYRLFFSNWSPVRLFDVDLKRFPLFRFSKPRKVIVEPGDALYIPNPWWHSVIALDDELQITSPHWLQPRRLCLSSPQTRSMLRFNPRASAARRRKGVDVPGWLALARASFSRRYRARAATVPA